MAPLIILIACFGTGWLLNVYAFRRKYPVRFFGKLAMSLMLIATGVTHFTKTAAMVQSMPGFISYKSEVVYATGIIELLAALFLLAPRFSSLVSILLILFLLCVLPANVTGSIKRVDLGGMNMGPLYLLFRIPLQLFFIGWIYYFGIRDSRRQQSTIVTGGRLHSAVMEK